jgi:Uma2 family endonuclease
MTAPLTKLYTAEEFAKLPDPDHGGKTELVRGEVTTKMPVGGRHSICASDISGELRHFVRRHALGLVGVEGGFTIFRGPDTVKGPDVHFVRTDRLVNGEMPEGFFEGAPDLAVEVMSPDDTEAEVFEKVQDYLAAGSARVWVVRPQSKTVTVHRPGGDAHTFGSDDTLSSADAGFDVEGFELKPRDVC